MHHICLIMSTTDVEGLFLFQMCKNIEQKMSLSFNLAGNSRKFILLIQMRLSVEFGS